MLSTKEKDFDLQLFAEDGNEETEIEEDTKSEKESEEKSEDTISRQEFKQLQDDLTAIKDILSNPDFLVGISKKDVKPEDTNSNNLVNEDNTLNLDNLVKEVSERAKQAAIQEIEQKKIAKDIELARKAHTDFDDYGQLMIGISNAYPEKQVEELYEMAKEFDRYTKSRQKGNKSDSKELDNKSGGEKPSNTKVASPQATSVQSIIAEQIKKIKI